MVVLLSVSKAMYFSTPAIAGYFEIINTKLLLLNFMHKHSWPKAAAAAAGYLCMACIALRSMVDLLARSPKADLLN